jgi:hypothetical protein
MLKKFLVTSALSLAALTTAATAGTFTFSTAAGAVDSVGQPVDASATVTTGAGTITVVLNDLLANPTDAGQLLSDFMFTLSTAPTTALNGTTTPTGTLICIPSTPCTTTTITSWGLTSTGSTILLNSLAGGPSETIIGPGPYTNANGSISGNDPHNPFLNQTATFTFSVAGVTASTTVTSASFSFGTVAGDEVPGVPGGGGPGGGTPEPGTIVMACTGLALTMFRFVPFKKRA